MRVVVPDSQSPGPNMSQIPLAACGPSRRIRHSFPALDRQGRMGNGSGGALLLDQSESISPTRAQPAASHWAGERDPQKPDLVVHEAEPTLMGGNLRLRRRESGGGRWDTDGEHGGPGPKGEQAPEGRSPLRAFSMFDSETSGLGESEGPRKHRGHKNGRGCFATQSGLSPRHTWC